MSGVDADVGILGGGLTGLTLSSLLKRKAEVLEARDRAGGLLRTFGRGGFLSDIGGHILFSKDQPALDLLVGALGENVERRRRANAILFHGAFVKYPFENGLSDLPAKEDTLACVEGFVRAWAESRAPRPPPANLAEWCLRTFGPGISERYLLPYNEKIWKRSASQIAADWVERVPQPPLQDVLRSAVGIPTEGYVHQLYFQYPRAGGIEAVARGLAAAGQARGQVLRTGFRARQVRRSADGWVVTDGKEERTYRELVTTLPLLPFLEALADVPPSVLAAAGELRHNAMRVVLLGVDRPGLDRHTAVYVPDRNSIYHRVCFNNAFSPAMAPSGASSVSVEITCQDDDAVGRMEDEALVARVVDDLERDGLVRKADVCERLVQRERYAYVVYDLGYAGRLSIVRRYLEELGVHAVGRFAEFDYMNMDGCVRHAMALARRLDGEGER